MNIPEEFKGRVVRTRLSGMQWNTQLTKKITEEYPGAEIDVIFETPTSSRIVIVFETREDSLSYHLKYGGDYV